MKKKFGATMLATAIALGGVTTAGVLNPVSASAAETVYHNDANFYENSTWQLNGTAFDYNSKSVKQGDVFTHDVKLDDYENPVANTNVRFHVYGGDINAYSNVATTNASGEAKLTFTFPFADQGDSYMVMVESQKTDGSWDAVTDIPFNQLRGSDIDYEGDGKLYFESVRSINTKFSSTGENLLHVNMAVTTSDDPDITDFQPRYTIQDAWGKIVKTGNLNKHAYTDTTSTYGKGVSDTDIDVSELAAGDYRIKVYQPVTGTELKYDSMECHFHIKNDRAVNDFIQGPLQP